MAWQPAESHSDRHQECADGLRAQVMEFNIARDKMTQASRGVGFLWMRTRAQVWTLILPASWDRASLMLPLSITTSCLSAYSAHKSLDTGVDYCCGTWQPCSNT